MDRGAWQAVGYGVTESDMSERTQQQQGMALDPLKPRLGQLAVAGRTDWGRVSEALALTAG